MLRLLGSDRTHYLALQIARLGELARLSCSRRTRNAQQERFNFSQVLIANGQIDREMIPGIPVPVLSMSGKSVTKGTSVSALSTFGVELSSDGRKDFAERLSDISLCKWNVLHTC